MLQKSAGLVLCLLFFLAPQTAGAGIEWQDLRKLPLQATALDVASSVDGKLFFTLTPGEILVYSLADEKLLDRIPVDMAFTRIATANDDKVILTAANSPSIRIMRISYIYPIDLTDRPYLGPADAPVTIAVFDDYQCPYCSRLDQFMQQVMDKYPGKIKLVIKHFPLASHPLANRAAMAALAADKQGKFWEFHHELLRNYNSLTEEKIKAIASSLSLDMPKFEAELDSAASQKRIMDDLRNGRDIGVNGTPSVFLNGKKVENLSALPQMIEKMVDKAP